MTTFDLAPQRPLVIVPPTSSAAFTLAPPPAISPRTVSLDLSDFDRIHLPEDPGDPDHLDAVVISDLHLGSDNCQAKAAAAFLQDILDGRLSTRRLIINGDVFDSIDFRRLKKTHWKVLSQIRHLSDKIQVVWIAGNHDGSADIVSHLLGVQVVEEFILRSGQQNILIIHGHQFDEFINDHPILTCLADAIYWLLQKIDRTHYVARLAKTRSKTFIRCAAKIKDGARRRATELDCSAAICGHTHHAESLTDHAVAYHNSGCWTENPPTYLTVRAGKIESHTYVTAEVPALAAAQ
jgi:UDP-2,3-diacylglucosamine pyrophosphatase LpxH